MGNWYRYHPNIDLLKQTNVWGGLSDAVKGFFERAEENALNALNKEKIGLDMQHAKEDLAHKRQINPLLRESQNTKNAQESFNLKMDSIYKPRRLQAELSAQDLANKQGAFNYGLLQKYGEAQQQAQLDSLLANIANTKADTLYRNALAQGAKMRGQSGPEMSILQIMETLKNHPKFKDLSEKDLQLLANDYYLYGQSGEVADKFWSDDKKYNPLNTMLDETMLKAL